jgi:perosamine synthetase
VEHCITPRTKAIIPVHLYGHPADMDALSAIARTHGVAVVEDAAQAHGALYKGKPAGALSDIAAFSLFGNKVITAGEGGLVATDRADLDDKVRLYRDQGLSKDTRTSYHYWHPVVGFNYGMSNMQAAVAVAQLERLEHFVDRRRAVFSAYCARLGNSRYLEFAHEMPWARSNFWMTSLLVRPESPLSRDELIEALRAEGVDSRPFFYPIHTLPPYNTGQHLPVTEDVAARGLNLPSSTSLSEDVITRVTDTITRLLRA